MKCPNDDTTLVMSERQSIEIDYCPTCRGVWLDRGELDKIIERSAAQAPAEQPKQPQVRFADEAPQHYASRPPKYDDHATYEHSKSQYGYQKKKKKESFLGDLFDF